ncbi:MAG TPA: hypothetical protein DHV30_04345 [Balneola sp.]|nr:hypothetical protein [Balneola sp.]|tara:strand:+ start:1689 stop:2099 length:411 start_codon:yes stop_codon:yes gene_type:complete
MALSLWSNTAIAESPGKFTFLGLNQCAPFEGVLFDPPATAFILSEAQAFNTFCEARLKYELGLQEAEYQLDLENITIRHDALVSEYDMRVQSLERESDALAAALKKQSKKDPWMWFAIGIVGGVAMSYTVYEVISE